MEILNSKAYYLKNYIPRTKAKSTSKPKPTDNRLPKLNKNINNVDQLIKMRQLNKAKKHSHSGSSHSAHSTNSFIQYPNSTNTTKYKDITNIVQKQKDVLKKVVTQKMTESRSKRQRAHTISTSNDYILIEKHPLSDVTTLEVQSMKPTERYFHMMNNVHLAEKLLLSRPSVECSTRHLKDFYHKQNQYKGNISKLGFRSKRETELSRLKLLNRRKWMD